MPASRPTAPRIAFVHRPRRRRRLRPVDDRRRRLRPAPAAHRARRRPLAAVLGRRRIRGPGDQRLGQLRHRLRDRRRRARTPPRPRSRPAARSTRPARRSSPTWCGSPTRSPTRRARAERHPHRLLQRRHRRVPARRRPGAQRALARLLPRRDRGRLRRRPAASWSPRRAGCAPRRSPTGQAAGARRPRLGGRRGRSTATPPQTTITKAPKRESEAHDGAVSLPLQRARLELRVPARPAGLRAVHLTAALPGPRGPAPRSRSARPTPPATPTLAG